MEILVVIVLVLLLLREHSQTIAPVGTLGTMPAAVSAAAVPALSPAPAPPPTNTNDLATYFQPQNTGTSFTLSTDNAQIPLEPAPAPAPVASPLKPVAGVPDIPTVSAGGFNRPGPGGDHNNLRTKTIQGMRVLT